MRRFLLCMAFACIAPAANADTASGAPGVMSPAAIAVQPSPTPQPQPALEPATPTGTNPVTLTVAGKQVVLALPEGMCAYDRSDPPEARLLDILEKGNAGVNQVLLAFADCNDLAELKKGMGTGVAKGYYGQILSEIDRQSLGDSYSRGAYVKDAAAGYDQGQFSQGISEAQNRLKAQNVNNLADASTPGIINQDPDFLQVGLVQSGMGADGVIHKVDGIVSVTKLGVPVSINLYHLDDSPSAWAALNKASVDYARKLVALNPDSFLLHADERAEGFSAREAFEIAAFALAACGVFLFLKRRKRITS